MVQNAPDPGLDGFSDDVDADDLPDVSDDSNDTVPDLPGLKKQISLSVPFEDWKLIRLEAAQRKVPMTKLVRGWIDSSLENLKKSGPGAVTLPKLRTKFGGKKDRRQISIFFPRSRWKLIRDQAAKNETSMTNLVRGWLEPSLEGLRKT